jgi:hypothetical protein
MMAPFGSMLSTEAVGCNYPVGARIARPFHRISMLFAVEIRHFVMIDYGIFHL